MFREFLVALFLLWSSTPLFSENVEITGKYQLVISCNKNYHEETPVLVQKGKSKFSGKFHTLDIPKSYRKNLHSGMKIKIKGNKKPSMKKKMTKGEVRKIMLNVLQNKEGLAFSGKEVPDIMSKILVKKKAVAKNLKGLIKKKPKEKPKSGIKEIKKNKPLSMINSNHAHDHGELQLMAVADDHEEVEVTIEAHISVTNIEVVSESK